MNLLLHAIFKFCTTKRLFKYQFFSHFRLKIYFAVIAHNTKQQCGFGFALPPEELHITPSLGTTALKGS